MRIGIEAQRIFRPKKHGMDVVALQTLLSLQEIDKENEYVVFVKPDEDDLCLKESSNMQILKVSGLTYPDWEQISLPLASKKMGLQLLHCTSNTAPLFSPVPTVITLHDIIYLENIDFGGTTYQNFGNLYRRFIVPRVAKKASRLITVSEFEKKQITKGLNISDEKVSVVYNAISKKFNPHYTRQELEQTKIKYQLPSNFILFLGNKAPKKNTERVLLAYGLYVKQTSNPLPLVILDYEKSLAQTIYSQEPDIMNFLIFPGYISSSEIPRLYCLASLFLYPSLRESFGLPILEAMACGTPVITSNTSAMPEIAGGAALLVDPFSTDEIAQKISSSLSGDDERMKYMRLGLERAALFSWENTARSVLGIYKELINN